MTSSLYHHLATRRNRHPLFPASVHELRALDRVVDYSQLICFAESWGRFRASSTCSLNTWTLCSKPGQPPHCCIRSLGPTLLAVRPRGAGVKAFAAPRALGGRNSIKKTHFFSKYDTLPATWNGFSFNRDRKRCSAACCDIEQIFLV